MQHQLRSLLFTSDFMGTDGFEFRGVQGHRRPHILMGCLRTAGSQGFFSHNTSEHHLWDHHLSVYAPLERASFCECPFPLCEWSLFSVIKSAWGSVSESILLYSEFCPGAPTLKLTFNYYNHLGDTLVLPLLVWTEVLKQLIAVKMNTVPTSDKRWRRFSFYTSINDARWCKKLLSNAFSSCAFAYMQFRTQAKL